MKHFHSFRLDTANECLWRGEERITLTRKAFAVGRHLIDHADRLVTKEELMEAVWPDRHVGEENLKQYILELRRALGDQARNPSFTAHFVTTYQLFWMSCARRCVVIERKPAFCRYSRVFSSPHIAPSPSPPCASETVMQCMR
jgi:Transcriptional regulatory protein, C terminal